MKKYFTLIILFLIAFLNSNKMHAQNYPQWYCMSHDEMIYDMAFDNQYVWIATRGGLVKMDRVTGVNEYYNAANSPLYSNEIKAVEVDDSGNVWIGSYYGDLVKFDGTFWTHYWTLNGTDSLFGINEIHKDRNGNIYVSGSGNSWQGIYKYNGVGFDDLMSPTTSILSFSIDTLNNLWCGTYSDLMKYDGSIWFIYDSTNSPINAGLIYSVSVDATNKIWISVYETVQPNNIHIYYLNDTTWTYIPPSQSGIGLNQQCRITTDKNGNVFFYGNLLVGYKKYDGVNFTSSLIPNHEIYYFEVDSAQHYWMMLSSLQNDTTLYEFDGLNLTGHFASNSLLISDQVNTFVCIDHDGNRWFAHNGRGLQKFDGYNWTNYDTLNSNLTNNDLYCVNADNNNNIWVGANGCAINAPLSKFDGTNWTQYNLSYFGACSLVEGIEVDKLNQVWIQIRGKGVAKYDGLSWTNWNAVDAGFNSFFCLDIALDTNDNLWASANGVGLVKCSNNSWSKFDMSNSNIISNYVINVFADRNNTIWFTTDYGLSKFDGSVFTNYGKNNDSIHGSPYRMTEDKFGNIWICTNEGITKFDGSNWTNYNKYNSGLGELQVWDISIDKNNTKWISAFDGVFLFNENGISPQMWHNVPQTKFEGKIFYDANSDGLCDTLTDLGMINQKVICLNDSSVTLSNSQGIYRFYRDSGNYQSAFNPYPNWNITSDSLSYQTSIDTSSVFGLDYGTFPFYPFNQLDISLTAGTNHCNSQTPFWIEYKNTGTNISTGVITFVKHDSLTFISSNTLPIYISGDTIMLYYSNLLPYETRSIVLVMQNPSVNSINDTLLSYITIYDAANTTDSASVTQIISCAYDPNDKSVFPIGFTPQHLTHMGDSLEYTIRFQNLGNDTAYSIYILDTIPSTMEKDSFVFIASSHQPDIEISKAGAIRFMFNNIMLPPMSTNEPGSMGYVKYRLKPKPNLPNNTEVQNTAYIYFDFNPAVITNTVSNIYVNTMTGMQEHESDFSLTAYPNPFDNLLWIQLKNLAELKSLVSIYDVTGRKVFEKEFQSSLIQLRLEDITPGLYFISVKNGNAMQRFKVVKE